MMRGWPSNCHPTRNQQCGHPLHALPALPSGSGLHPDHVNLSVRVQVRAGALGCVIQGYTL